MIRWEEGERQRKFQRIQSSKKVNLIHKSLPTGHAKFSPSYLAQGAPSLEVPSNFISRQFDKLIENKKLFFFKSYQTSHH